jgi:hypothetical protein
VLELKANRVEGRRQRGGKRRREGVPAVDLNAGLTPATDAMAKGSWVMQHRLVG